MNSASVRCVHQELLNAAEESPDWQWLTFSNGRGYSVGELANRMNSLATALEGLGVGRGDRVALMLDNGIEFIDCFFASNAIGAIVVPINTALRGNVLVHILRLSEPKVVVVDAKYALRFQGAAAESDWSGIYIAIGASPTASFGNGSGARIDMPDLLAENPGEHERNGSPTDASAIMFTSGTTGPAKGVVWSHGVTMWNADVCRRGMGYTSKDILYTCLPLFHSNALYTSLMPSLAARAAIFVGSRFSASAFWEEVVESGATSTNLLGAMTTILLKRDQDAIESEHDLRTALVIPAPEEHHNQIRARFGIGIVEAYGLTDFGMILWGSSSLSEDKPGSCGKPVPGVECRVVDDFDFEVPVGSTGQLVVRPSHPWAMPMGYWRMPEQTLEAYRNLWFHTGDLMYQEADGSFYFVDRQKDAIRRRGENISSFEVEEAFLEHGDVIECAAYAVESEFTEDEVAVAVVPAAGAAVSEEALLRFVEPRLPYFAVPRFIRIVDELPKTQTEKVMKAELRAAGVSEKTWDRELAGVELRGK